LKWISLYFFSRLVLKWNPPNLFLSSSWDHRSESLCLVNNHFNNTLRECVRFIMIAELTSFFYNFSENKVVLINFLYVGKLFWW
jgi:hypothetical protein